jgi:hypothetical protein
MFVFSLAACERAARLFVCLVMADWRVVAVLHFVTPTPVSLSPICFAILFIPLFRLRCATMRRAITAPSVSRRSSATRVVMAARCSDAMAALRGGMQSVSSRDMQLLV